MQMNDKIFLSDKRTTRKGEEKERSWRWHKVLSAQLSESYMRIGDEAKAIRVKVCASWLQFRNYIEYQDEVKKLHGANFCQVRLCPMCSGRRSYKIFGQVSKIMNYMTGNHEYEYIFLTLTVRNVVGNDLSKTIDEMLLAWKAMTRTKEFKKLAKGYFRALEVTKKPDKDFHPHIHVIIAVNKSYFDRTGGRGYLHHREWMGLWRRCMNLDYDPRVDIRKVKEDVRKKDKKNISYAGAVAEVAKYTVKGSEVIIDPYRVAKNSGIPTDGEAYEKLTVMCQNYTDEMVSTLDGALKGRRLVSFGGKMREVHKLLNLEDPTKGDLINTDNEEKMHEGLKYVVETYEWQVAYMNYVLVKVNDGCPPDLATE